MNKLSIDFRSKTFLLDHIKSILDFYEPNIIDQQGGFFHNFLDDGTTFDTHQKHLVSSTRMIFNYAKAYELFGNEVYKQHAQHGFDYLRNVHWDGVRKGYNWTLNNHAPDDQTNHCYGLAFVILAHCAAAELKLSGAEQGIEDTWQLMEDHFWQPEQGLYADEVSSDWSETSSYRGQNANMHSCEAMLAAHSITREEKYLNRAYALAKKITVELAGKANGLIWEHYDSNLNIDWDYNRDDPKNLYRPWGFQPGHQTEWAKLLLILYEFRPEVWMRDRAEALFNAVLPLSWDEKLGGIFYGFDPEGKICDDEKYFWVQAETFAAAARLAAATGNDVYWQWYDKIWDYSYTHMIDHRYSAWYRVLNRQNQRLSNQKSTAGGKCDYHTLGACYDVYKVLK